MATRESGFRGKVLLVAALGFGGLLFIGRYLVMGLMYVAQRLDLPTAVIAGLDLAYLYPLGVLFAQPGIYWGFSGLSLLLIAAALIGARPERTLTAALVTVALIVVGSAVFLRSRPAVEARPGVSMRVPTLPGWWERPAKYFRIGVERRRCSYTIEGWDRSGGLLYVETCGERQRRWRYVPASDTRTPVDAIVDLLVTERVARPTDRVTARIPGDLGLDLTIRTPVFRSPDGRWEAFVARHVYGPEDVVVVRSGVTASQD
jgi:hypothetical protein